MSRPGAAAPARPGLGAARGRLVVLALAVFAAVTTETLPVGLLPAMGRSFGTSPATTGLLVTLYAALVAVLAVPLTLATRNVPRKRLLLITTGSLLVSNALAAAAPTFAVLATARALGGATHAVFFSVAIGYATRLVPPAQAGRALALASAGTSAGFVLGVPLATILGTAVGWRGSFAILAALTAVVLVLALLRLPAVGATADDAPGIPAHRKRLIAAVVANALVYAGQYTLYTYVSPLLLRAGAPSGAVGPILMVFGALGLVGLWLAGPQLDHRPRASALAVLTVLGLGIVATGTGFPILGLVVVAGAAWNGAFGPVASLFQTAAVRTRALSPDLAGAWVVSTSNLGIATGAALGGAVLERVGMSTVAWSAAVPILLAVVVVGVATGAFPRRPSSTDPAGPPRA